MDIITFSELASLLSISDRIRKWLKKDNKPETITDRFMLLFEKHGVCRNQIPRFFDHGIELEDIENHEKLLAKLSHKTLKAACDLFAVRIEWIEGADEEIYAIHHFNKDPDEYNEFLTALRAHNTNKITAKVVISSDPAGEYDTLVILEEYIDNFGDKAIYRYHLCSGWIHKYWKSRPDLTACIAATLKQHVFMKGQLTSAKIDTFCAGEGFIIDLDSLPHAFKRHTWSRKHVQHWHPDEWIYNPISFLDGIAEGDFGKVNALEKWLDYFDSGHLETGYHREGVRAQFSALLDNFQDP